MLTSGHDKVAPWLRLLRSQGMERQYVNELVGLDARKTDLDAAVGRVRLNRVANGRFSGKLTVPT